MMLLKTFLRHSSIHGLRYLTEAKGWVPKLLWMLCIMASCSVAVVMIYCNVSDWENSPTVVSSVKLVELEVLPTRHTSLTASLDSELIIAMYSGQTFHAHADHVPGAPRPEQPLL